MPPAAPELGRSGLDAVELMNIGVNYMREHMPDDARVHYAYLDAGGTAPNVVQARATVRQLVRARDLPGLRDLIARVDKIAEGRGADDRDAGRAAGGVGRVEPDRQPAAGRGRCRPISSASARRSSTRTTARYAEAIRATLTPDHIAANFRKLGMAPRADLPLCDFIAPLDRPRTGGEGSTDVGDVSWAVPTVQARVATCALGTPLHTWQMTAQGKSGMAHKGLIHAAKVMAATARDLIEAPERLTAAKAAHAAFLAGSPYSCPMPDEVQPPVQPRPVAAE